MNSPSVRVEWPIVSTVVEGSRLARLFPPRPVGLVLTADGLIFGICLRDSQRSSDSMATMPTLSSCFVGREGESASFSDANFFNSTTGPELFLPTESGIQ